MVKMTEASNTPPVFDGTFNFHLNRINVENMRTWLASLRSGEYKQAQGALKVADSYCCLGVACEVSHMTNWLPNQYSDENVYQYLDEGYELPERVARWLGLVSNDVGWEGDMFVSDPIFKGMSLALLNDKHGYNFTDIADLIETSLREAGVDL